MNDFDSTETNPGLLKNTYGETGISEALSKKRKKLAESKLGLTPKEEVSDDADRQ